MQAEEQRASWQALWDDLFGLAGLSGLAELLVDGHTAALLREARAAQEVGDLPAAEERLRELLQPLDAAARRAMAAGVRTSLGCAALLRGAPLEALALLEPAVRDAPIAVRHLTMLWLGDACQRLGQQMRAQAAYVEGLRLARVSGSAAIYRSLVERLVSGPAQNEPDRGDRGARGAQGARSADGTKEDHPASDFLRPAP